MGFLPSGKSCSSTAETADSQASVCKINLLEKSAIPSTGGIHDFRLKLIEGFLLIRTLHRSFPFSSQQIQESSYLSQLRNEFLEKINHAKEASDAFRILGRGKIPNCSSPLLIYRDYGRRYIVSYKGKLPRSKFYLRKLDCQMGLLQPFQDFLNVFQMFLECIWKDHQIIKIIINILKHNIRKKFVK